MFLRNRERTRVFVFLSKMSQEKSSKIILKPLSESWLILKRLYLRPPTKTTFSIKGDESISTLLIPTILPFESLQRWRWHLHDTLIVLQSYWYPKSCALSNHYQGITFFYVLEPWCIPILNIKFVNFGTQTLLGSKELVFWTKNDHLKHLCDHNKTWPSDIFSHNRCMYTPCHKKMHDVYVNDEHVKYEHV